MESFHILYYLESSHESSKSTELNVYQRVLLDVFQLNKNILFVILYMRACLDLACRMYTKQSLCVPPASTGASCRGGSLHELPRIISPPGLRESLGSRSSESAMPGIWKSGRGPAADFGTSTSTALCTSRVLLLGLCDGSELVDTSLA